MELEKRWTLTLSTGRLSSPVCHICSLGASLTYGQSFTGRGPACLEASIETERHELSLSLGTTSIPFRILVPGGSLPARLASGQQQTHALQRPFGAMEAKNSIAAPSSLTNHSRLTMVQNQSIRPPSHSLSAPPLSVGESCGRVRDYKWPELTRQATQTLVSPYACLCIGPRVSKLLPRRRRRAIKLKKSSVLSTLSCGGGVVKPQLQPRQHNNNKRTSLGSARQNEQI